MSLLRKSVRFCLLGVFIVLIHGCVKDEFDMNKLTTAPLTPEFGVPLVFSELSLEDMMSDFVDSLGFLRINDDNSISLLYKEVLFEQYANELFSIPNQSFENKEIFPIDGAFVLGDSMTMLYGTTFNFNLGYGEVLDSLIIKSGTLNADLSADINYDAKIIVTSTNVIVDGSPLRIVMDYKYLGTTPVIVNEVVDLAGARVVFNNGGLDTNVVNASFLVTAYASNDPVASPYECTFTTTFSDIEYSAVYGYFGQFNFTGESGTVSIDLFKNEIAGGIQLDNPKLGVNINNSMGIPLNISFDDFFVYSKQDTSIKDDITGIPNPWNVNYPTSPGMSDSTNIVLNSTTSNIVDLLNDAPEFISYTAGGMSNPSGNVGQNFVLDTSRLSIEVDVEIPLAGRVQGITLSDTVKFSFEDLVSDIDMIEYINFLIKVDNYFPVDVVLQVYFMDSANTWPPVDSLFGYNEKFLDAAVPGAAPDYKVTTATSSFKKVMLEKSRATKLENVENLIIKGVVSTYNQGNNTIKIYTSNKLGVKLGVQAQLNLDL